ncbi:MAG: HEAT repeat domain-containing protein [Chloroflexota bacterium]
MKISKEREDIVEAVTYTTSERLVQDFASRGIVILAPESLGIPAAVHERLYERELAAYHANEPITPKSMPEILEVLNAPGLVAALNQIVGENWAVVPFTHNAPFASGPRDQHWHKDDNGPYNGRKQRHHQAVQVEMIYYPQTVLPEMGPTATVPYSHYWTFNHEENHDNFAGADHLDFDYVISGMERVPVSGPDSQYDVEDIVQRRTAHDIRMREAVTKTGWPLVKQLEAAPLRAGSIILYSHNTFHRGNHRRDDWRRWRDNPRFMWRFFLYRTMDAASAEDEPFVEPTWDKPGVDPLTQIDLTGVSDDLTAVWRYHHHWLKTGQAPPPRPAVAQMTPNEREHEAARLFNQLHAKYDEAEPTRIGAAYQLASIGDDALAVQLLGQALYSERESVRRAATYGLIAVGSAATETFLEATTSPVKWVRKAAVYGLGDASPLTAAVLAAVVERLHEDPSVYVRSVAAGTLGCLGRRAVATGVGTDLIPACLEALVQSLAREENRLGMSLAQGRSIKFVRPTDDCDVCEGDGVDFGFERFKPVRSAVRENGLWAMVILCSHGSAVVGKALEPTLEMLRAIIRDEENAICVGFAMDALARLVHLKGDDDMVPPTVAEVQANLVTILGDSPMQSWESLVRGGMPFALLNQFS